VLGHWLDHLLNLKVVHAFAKKMLALATAVPSTVKQADSFHRGVGPWKIMASVEWERLKSIDWFNNHRLL
jgi:hypothetical protein